MHGVLGPRSRNLPRRRAGDANLQRIPADCTHVDVSFLGLRLHLCFQLTDQRLEIVALAERLEPRVVTELVGVVEAGGEVVTEGLDGPVGGMVDARAVGQGRGEGQVVGEVVEVAGLLLAKILGDLDGLGGIRTLAGSGESFALAGQQLN